MSVGHFKSEDVDDGRRRRVAGAGRGGRAVLDDGDADAALAALRAHPLGAAAARIGRVTADARCFVQLRTQLGGRRMVDWLSAEQLPRIC